MNRLIDVNQLNFILELIESVVTKIHFLVYTIYKLSTLYKPFYKIYTQVLFKNHTECFYRLYTELIQISTDYINMIYKFTQSHAD